MRFGIGLSIVSQGLPGLGAIITAVTSPSLSALAVGDTPADGYTAGSYTSTAGTIASAVETYIVDDVTGASDDVLTDLQTVRVSVLVTDSEGNTATFSTGTVTATYAAPVASGALDDVSYTQGDGDQTVATAGDFTGSGITYSVNTVAGVSINASTGVVTISTTNALASSSIVVTATNSGGSDTTAFSVVVASSGAVTKKLIVYGHSLYRWTGGAGGADPETDVNSWLSRFAQHDGDDLEIALQFGQHNVYSAPMTSQQFASEATKFDGESWGGIIAAQPTDMIFTPANYNWQGDAPLDNPNSLDPTSGNSNVVNIADTVDAYIAQLGYTPNIWIVNTWPQLDPQTSSGLAGLKTLARSDYQAWFYQLEADLKAYRPSWASSVNLIDTSESFADLDDNTAFGTIAMADKFEDYTGPHGREVMYVQAAALIYKKIYGRAPPTDYTMPGGTDSTLSTNWSTIAGYIDTNESSLGGAVYPGQVSVSNVSDHGVKVVAASTGLGLDVTFSTIGAPVGWTTGEYTTNGGTNWRSLGLTGAGSVNLTVDSAGTTFAESTSVDIRFRGVNANGTGRQSDAVTATTGAGVSFSADGASGELVVNGATGAITLTVTSGPYATVDVGNGNGIFTTTETAVEAGPVLLATQPIGGTVAVGNVVTGGTGLWLYDTDNGTLTTGIQWQADTLGNGTFADISGATSTSYTILAADNGDDLRYEVTGTQPSITAVTGNSTEVSVPATGGGAATVTMDGTQDIGGFSTASATSFDIIYRGLNIQNNLPTAQYYLFGLDDGANDITVYLRSTERVACTINQSAVAFGQSTFGEDFPVNADFDLRIEFDTAGGLADGNTFAISIDTDGGGWVRWIEKADTTTAQNMTSAYLFRSGATTADKYEGILTEGVTVTINGVEALDLNPCSPTLFNSDSDNDARSFTHTGTFA